MLILISGPNGSGKSSWAEKLAVSLGAGRRLYIATMIPHGEEGRARVERHRRQRRHGGFITLEAPHTLAGLMIEAGDMVLLEDVSNLTANLLFGADLPMRVTAQAVLDQILAVAERAECLIAVTISGIEPKPDYDGPTLQYIELLNQVNQGLFALADTAYELCQGQPRLQKGVEPCLF